MLYEAKNGKVRIGDTYMDFIRFGRGDKVLVMLPGLSDGLRTVKGLALPLAVLYRRFARDYQVFVCSRKAALSSGCTSRDMARDQAAAMEELGIERAYVLGISQGGTIAQYLAIDYPEKVERLVLGVTFSRSNDMLRQVIGRWIELAHAGNYAALMVDTAERVYSEPYLRHRRKCYPVLTRWVTKR